MTTKNSHILLVDDNSENIQALGTALRQKNYRVTTAESGELAIQAAEELIPDLILLDIMMPEMDGFQVCQILKANPRTQDIEIIFITAAVAHSDELKGLSLGAVDYIHKPFSIPLLQAKVALHLERADSKKELRLKNASLEENARLRDDIECITRHDLKTPLNAIMCYPELMLFDDTLSAEHREYLEEILKAGKEMLYMINNSLDLFKMETGRYQYDPDLVDISLIIKGVIRDLESIIERYGVKINLSQELPIEGQIGQADNFIVLAEKNLSYSMFANLIRNAIEACSVGDTIRIVMCYEGNDGVITITNPGSVPEVIRDSFFEKYATAGKKQGTGLGTYSAKLMATTQNGTIAMTSNSQETCITVKLPRA